MLYNRWTVGVFLPSSGVAKAGFVLRDNVGSTLHMLLPNLWGAPGQQASPYPRFNETYSRVFGMVVPAVVCGLYLRRWRRVHLLGALCGGVLLKSLYNFFIVALFAQGSWYYGVNLCVANLCLAVLLEDLLSSTAESGQRAPSWHTAGALLLSFAVVAISANAFLNWIFLVGGSGPMTIFEDRGETRRMLSHAGADRFVEFNDGMLSYSTGYPAVAGMGLALDSEANQARRQGHLLRLLHARGYTVALATKPYQTILDAALSNVRRGEPTAALGLQAAEFNEFLYQAESVTGDGLTTLYRLVPRSSNPAQPSFPPITPQPPGSR